MKSIITKAVAVILLLTIILTFSGCYNNDDDSLSYETREILKQSITNYLVSNYDINKADLYVALTMNKVSEQSLNYRCHTHTEDYSFETIVWIDENFNLSCDYFMKDFQKTITPVFDSIIKEEIPNCTVSVITKLKDKQIKEWTSEDDVMEFFKTEKTYSHIQIFVNNSDVVSLDTIDRLTDKLGFCDATVMVHDCDYLKNGSEGSKIYEVVINKE